MEMRNVCPITEVREKTPKDAKSIPSLRKLRKGKSKDTLGAKESYLL